MVYSYVKFCLMHILISLISIKLKPNNDIKNAITINYVGCCKHVFSRISAKDNNKIMPFIIFSGASFVIRSFLINLSFYSFDTKYFYDDVKKCFYDPTALVCFLKLRFLFC